jgi:hypothetical protein
VVLDEAGFGMGSVVAYNHRSDVPSSSGGSGSGGGDVDETLRRLGNVETAVAGLKGQVDTIAATIPHLATAKSVDAIATTLPHLATKASVDAIVSILPHLATKASVDAIVSILPHLATAASVSELKSELAGSIAAVRSDMSAMETRIIKWFITTAITLTTLATTVAFSIAKFVH